jgi:hypothetical protein
MVFKIIQNPNQLILTTDKKRNLRQIKSNINDTLNDADNLEDFEDTCVNTAPIEIISATIACTF